MDPNAALTKMRDAAKVLWDEPGDSATALDATLELRDAFADLDEWLTKGGFLPDAWRTDGSYV